MTPLRPLREWEGPARLLALLFTLSLCGGYAVALLNVHDKSTESGARTFSLDATITRYRGEGWTDAASGEGPVSYSHLVDLTHVHAFSMPMLFFLLAGLFLLSSCPAWLQKALIGSAFLDLWINMGSLWLIRYGSWPRAGASLLFLSGIVMFLCFAGMTLSILLDLRRGAKEAP